MDNSMLILAYDGDNAGRLVGRAILADNQDELSQVSGRIVLGHEIVQQWVADNGGSIISGGGDEGTFKIPHEALQFIEQLRNDYQFATNLTMTVGVGATLSEAGKALLVGKFRGKNMVVLYDANIEQEIDQAQKNVEEGNASSEERKLSEAYLKPENGETKPPEEQLMDYAAAGENPPQIDKPDPKKEPKQEQNNIRETPSMNNHPEDYMPAKQKEDNARDDADQSKEYAEDRAVESNNQVAEDKHSEAAMRAIAEAIEGDEKPGQTEKDKLSHVDDEDMAISTEMEDNTSRPDGFKDKNTPGDMGLAEDEVPEESPDLSSVLKDGLDNHADNMQREKVIDMVSQALEGFKANKHILERAKDKAPELYNSCLSMLKAMIEMTKMLGLGQEEEQNPLQDENQEAAPEASEEAIPEADHEQADAHDEENCPYCNDGADATSAEEEHDKESCPYCQDPEEECPHCVAMEAQAHKKPEADGKEPSASPDAKDGKPESKQSALPEKKKPAAPSEGAAGSPKKMGQ